MCAMYFYVKQSCCTHKISTRVVLWRFVDQIDLQNDLYHPDSAIFKKVVSTDPRHLQASVKTSFQMTTLSRTHSSQPRPPTPPTTPHTIPCPPSTIHQLTSSSTATTAPLPSPPLLFLPTSKPSHNENPHHKLPHLRRPHLPALPHLLPPPLHLLHPHTQPTRLLPPLHHQHPASYRLHRSINFMYGVGSDETTAGRRRVGEDG